MRKFFTAFALTVFPLAAQAQALGNLAGCERVAGQMESSDNVFLLWPDRIERWESYCNIVDVDGDPNVRSMITTQCSGEGETWEQVYGMTPMGDDAFMIWPAEYPEVTFELRQCG